MSSKFSPANVLSGIEGMVAVVTGGGTGLGLIIAKTLEANGAKVYITGRRKEKLDEAVKEAAHGNIIPIQGNVSSRADLQAAVDQITKEVGHIDLLVCNAGQSTFESGPNARPKPTTESSLSEIRDYYFNYRDDAVWTQTLNTNVAAVFLTTLAFLELLDAGNKKRAKDLPTSQVITISSVAGITKALDSYMYGASKAAVTHLMKNMGHFLVPHDIRTNIIAPGWFPSDMTTVVSKMFEGTGGVMPRSLVPQQRMGNENEFAGTILYLVSKAGGYCNGNVVVIDGGYLANHA